MTTDDKGLLHRHADGREHRHFSAGFEIGKQVIKDDDGSGEHSHFTMIPGQPDSRGNDSGPVVWIEETP